MTASCFYCHHWVADPDVNYVDSWTDGECLRYPPTPVWNTQTREVTSCNPITRGIHRCGEFTPKDQ